MADEDQYIFRLGVDYRDLDRALNAVLNLTGRVDAAFAKLPKGAAAQLSAVNRSAAGLSKTLRDAGGNVELTVDDKKALAAEKRQATQLAKLKKQVKEAQDAYATYLRDTARGSGVPAGKPLTALSDGELAKLQAAQKALSANGVTGTSGFTQAVNAEVTSRANAAKKITADAAAEEARRTAAAAKGEKDRIAAANKAAAEEANAQRRASNQAIAIEKATVAGRVRAAREYEAALPRLRYGIYDIANTSAVAGAGLLGIGVGILKVGADYETAYAQVKRTSDILTDPKLSGAQKNQQFAALRSDLVGLSEEIPKSFADIAAIATTGNQLGIASGNIASFTKTVAEFSAVTNVSTDAAATAFGRLGELLNDTNYKKIGDEIAYLGVKSVATESDIINTATQLAVSGQGIKLTTQDVLALSTTVASLGVRPEQARGTFIRAFSQIGTAVNAGGASLNAIAKLAHTTADGFKKDFNEGGDSAYEAFLAFTRGLGTNSAEINANLASIGITSVRDRQTFGLLAQNGGRALKDLANAAKGASNDFLATEYATQADTVNAKLTTLGNTALAIFDQIGQVSTGPLAALLGAFQGLLEGIQHIVSSPLTAWTLAIAAGLSILAGAGLLAFASFGRILGTLIALQQIQRTTINGQSGLTAAWKVATGQSEKYAQSVTVLATTQQTLTRSTLAAAEAQGALNAQGELAQSPIKKTTTGIGRLTSVLGKAGLYGGIAALALSIPSIAQAFADWIDQIDGSSVSVDTLTSKLAGLKGAAGKQNLADVLKALPGGAGRTFGDDFGAGFLDPAPLVNGGFRLDNGKTITGTQGAVNQLATGQKTPGTGVSLLNGSAQFDREVQTQLTKIKTVDTALTNLYQAGDKTDFDRGLALFVKSMKEQHVSADDAKAALVGLAAAEKSAGDAAGDATTSVADFNSALSALFQPNIDAQTATADVQALGKEVADSGASVAFNGKAMETVLQDIFASTDDKGVAKGRLQSLYAQLVKLGYSKTDLENVAAAISSISEPAKQSAIDISAFSSGVEEATKKTRTLADYASDLGSTFSRAFDLRFGDQTALDKVTQGYLDLKAAVKDTAQAVKDAKADLADATGDKAVKQYQLSVAEQYGDTATAAKLRGDIAKDDATISQKKTALSDAETKNSRKLTGNSQAAINNRSQLTGVIQNGQEYLQTLAANGATQDQLSAAAKRLKKQFIDQAVQAGYSKKEVTKLAGAYDDFTQIVKEVPRKITTHISSNASPAKKALAEYVDSLKAADGTTITTHIKQVYDPNAGTPSTNTGQQVSDVGTPTNANLPVSLTGTQAQRDAANAATKKAAADKANAAARAKILTDPHSVYPKYWESWNEVYRTKYEKKPANANEKELWIKYLKSAGVKLPPGFRQGGYTGSMPPWQAAGLVHGDEFVLNSAGYRMFPREMLEAANHGVQPQITQVQATAEIPNGMTVSLGRVERSLLSQGGGGTLTVRSDKIGSALDQAFAASDRRGSN